MLNVHSAGKEPYLSAPPLKPKTLYENLELAVLVSVDIVKVLILTAIELIKLPICVWTRSGPKTIKGQNALITGGANGIGKATALELAKFGCNIIIADVDDEASEKTLALLRKYDVTAIACSITGGANGIGKAIALELAKLGCNIIIVDLDAMASVKTLGLLKEYNVKAFAYSIDVSKPTEVDELRRKIKESLGTVDILVNNAGLMPLVSLREGSPHDIERIIDVNINANIWTLRTFLPDMISKKHGHIVQLSSMAAFHPCPGAIIYTATKFAVRGLMLTLEQELRQEGLGKYIDFTTVHPYFVSTRLDVMSAINLRFPAISPELTGEEIVKGIIYRKRRVCIPRFNDLFGGLISSLPYTVECLIRDYIIREPDTMVIKDRISYLSSKG